MSFDLQKDLAPVGMIATSPLVLTVNNKVPAKTVAELITYAKQNPKKLTFSSSGVGNPQQLTGELFNKLAGVQIMHVPYKGAAPQIADVAGKYFVPELGSFLIYLLLVGILFVRPQGLFGRR